ncbi:MAG: hypothetical protein ACJ749_18500 [Flavisolibacter sp.]
MKKMSLLTRISAMVFLASIAFVGCKKETSESLTPQQEEEAVTASSESETENELVFNDVFDNVMGVSPQVAVGGTGVFERAISNDVRGGREMGMDSVLPCVTVTLTHLTAGQDFPLKVVIDFGTAGCLGRDGHRRYGQMIIVYTGRLIIPGKSATTSFERFRIDDISVVGKHVITNTTGNTTGSNMLQYTIDVTDAKLSKPNGNYSIWNSHRVITQTEGNGTILPIDDVFKITGSARGKVKHGDMLYGWVSEITEPLIKKFSCHWISKGIIRVKRENLSDTSVWVATLNYGNGNCDFLATLTINGVEHQIQLPH